MRAPQVQAVLHEERDRADVETCRNRVDYGSRLVTLLEFVPRLPCSVQDVRNPRGSGIDLSMPRCGRHRLRCFGFPAGDQRAVLPDHRVISRAINVRNGTRLPAALERVVQSALPLSAPRLRRADLRWL